MVIDMNYWTRVIKRIAVLLFSLVLIYFSFKLAIFYIPFFFFFFISQLMDPLIKYVTKKTGMNRKTSAIWVLLIAFTILIILIVIGIITIVSESSRFITRTKLLY